MANNITKVYHEDGGDSFVIDSGGTLDIKSGGQITAAGTQASAITDATAAVSSPTKAEFDAVVTKLNSVLAALRGVGVIAS